MASQYNNQYIHAFYTVSGNILTTQMYNNAGNLVSSSSADWGANLMTALTTLDNNNTNPYTVGMVDLSSNKVQMDIAFSSYYNTFLTTTQQSSVMTYVNQNYKEPRTNATTIYTVTVSGGVYNIGGVAQPSITFTSGNLYVFDQSDATNKGNTLVLGTTNDISSTIVGNNVVYNGTAGSINAYTLIDFSGANPAPLGLYYFSQTKTLMGNQPPPPSVTGNVTITNLSSGKTMYRFYSGQIGTIQFYKTTSVGLFAIAGGGGGGLAYDGGGGGGGAGGYYLQSNLQVSGILTITVGTGGNGVQTFNQYAINEANASRIPPIYPNNGNNTIVNGSTVNVTCIGGGKGGVHATEYPTGVGSLAEFAAGNGGSGGGGSAGNNNAKTFGLGISGQGNNGSFFDVYEYGGGGGGGAGGPGTQQANASDKYFTANTANYSSYGSGNNGGVGMNLSLLSPDLVNLWFGGGGGGSGSKWQESAVQRLGKYGSGGSGVGGNGVGGNGSTSMVLYRDNINAVQDTGSGGGGLYRGSLIFNGVANWYLLGAAGNGSNGTVIIIV